MDCRVKPGNDATFSQRDPRPSFANAVARMSQRVRPEVAGPMTGSTQSGDQSTSLKADPGFRSASSGLQTKKEAKRRQAHIQ